MSHEATTHNEQSMSRPFGSLLPPHVRKVEKWEYKTRNMPRKRLPAIADRAVLGKVYERVSWNKGAWRSRESMEGCRREPRRGAVHREIGEVRTRQKQKKG